MIGHRMLVALNPLDGCARDVVLVAGSLAPRLGSEVTLFTCVPTGAPEGEAELRALLHELAELLGKTPATLRLGSGEPGRAILDAASAVSADLIVIGTHGRTGLQRAVLGSVSEWVVRRAVVPVVTVRAS